MENLSQNNLVRNYLAGRAYIFLPSFSLRLIGGNCKLFPSFILVGIWAWRIVFVFLSTFVDQLQLSFWFSVVWVYTCIWEKTCVFANVCACPHTHTCACLWKMSKGRIVCIFLIHIGPAPEAGEQNSKQEWLLSLTVFTSMTHSWICSNSFKSK